MGNYGYGIQTPGGVVRGRSNLDPDALRAQGFSEQELSRILAADPGPAPVLGANGDWSKSNFQEAMTNWEMASEAYKQGQSLLQGGPGSQGQVEFNKAASGFSKYGGDWVPALTMLGGGAVIGGGIAAGGALGGAGTGAGTEVAAGGGLSGFGGTAAATTPYIAAETGLAAPTAIGAGGAAGLTAAETAAATTAAGGLSEAGIEEMSTPSDVRLDPETGEVVNPSGPGNPPPAGPGGTATGAATALSRILDGTATTADWISALGTVGATGLGMYSSNQNANALRDIANQSRQDRAPFLGKANEWLANPEAYGAGPGRAAVNTTLGALGARFGNPIGSGTALQLATDAGLRDWRSAVTGFGNLGLSGEDTRATLLSGAAGKDADVYSNLAGGVSDLLNPKRTSTLADLYRQYQMSGLA